MNQNSNPDFDSTDIGNKGNRAAETQKPEADHGETQQKPAQSQEQPQKSRVA